MIREKENSEGFTCTCDGITPTSVVNDIKDIYSTDKIKDAFSTSGLE